MGALRKPFFFFAVVMIWLVVGIEIGSNWALNASGADSPPGWGIATMAFVDGVLAFRLTMMLLSLVVPARVLGRLQGIVTLILSFFGAIAAFILIFVILTQLMIMISLFLGVIFGTIAYLAIWGDFARGEAAVILSLLMTLKVAAAIALVLAHQRFLQIKSLVVIVLSSMVLNIIVAFLHGFPPRVLVSITDAIAGIIVTVIGLIYLILSLIGSIPAVLKLLRVDKALKRTPARDPWSLPDFGSAG